MPCRGRGGGGGSSGGGSAALVVVYGLPGVVRTSR